METHGFSEAQIQSLIDHAPQILTIVGGSIDPLADLVYSALSDFCWHKPACEKGDRCVHGEPGGAEERERLAALPCDNGCGKTRAYCRCDDGDAAFESAGDR